MAEYSHDDGMEGGADPCGSRGGGPDVRTGTYDGDGDGDGDTNDSGGAPGGGSDVSPPAGSATGSQPRPEEWIK